jgi:putative pyruvate formate lyase activating enzyme
MELSFGHIGKTVTIERLRAIYRELAAQGAHNINLVTATHFTDAVAKSLEPPPPIPVAWNSSGYESVETLRRLDGRVQIYMPDYKYALSEPAEKYSNAPDYPEVAAAAIREMYRQVGDYELDDDGIMTRGVLVRHLILPANLENTYRVIDWFAETFRHGQAMFSLMSQYTPSGAQHFPEMRRLITHDEYDAAVRYLEKSGIEDGFYQDEPTYAEADWIPKFDGTGV